MTIIETKIETIYDYKNCFCIYVIENDYIYCHTGMIVWILPAAKSFTIVTVYIFYIHIL